MKPKNSGEEDEKYAYLNQSLATGIFNWQEMAHMDFQELVELARKNGPYFEEIE